MGMWQTWHWGAAWWHRGPLLNAVLGWDKQGSFASTWSRQRAGYLWVTPSHPVTISTKLCSHRGTMRGASLLQGLCPGLPCLGHPFPQRLCVGILWTGHPLPWDLSPGHPARGTPSQRVTMHTAGLGHAGQAAPSAQQLAAPGGAFPQTEGVAPQSHQQQSSRLQLWGSGRNGVPLCTVRGGRRPVAVSLQCQLNGLWRNDQDSLMEISVVRDNGDFQGNTSHGSLLLAAVPVPPP